MLMEKLFKKAILDLHGYASPPQGEVRAKLNQNESPFDLPEEFKRSILEKASHLEWNRYPINESPVIKEKLARWHKVEPEQILLGNGSNQLLQTLLSATVNNEKSVLYCPPTFSLFELFPVIYEARLIPVYQPPANEFLLNNVLQEIETKDPELILLCSPNNPTGSVIELAAIEQICRRANGLVLVDEAYGEFAEQTAISMIREYPHVLVSRTFSKAFSLAGLRFGYFIGDKKIIEQLAKANLPYNVNLFTELVVANLLDDLSLMHSRVNYLKEQRNLLLNRLYELNGVIPYNSSANFILFKVDNSKQIAEKLKAQGVLVRDVSSYPLLENHLRVTVGSQEENELFLQALKNSLN